MRTFSFYCFLIHIQTFLTIMILKIIHPITFQNCTKYPIKVLRNKNNIWTCNLFIKRFPSLHLNILVPMYSIRETFLRYKTSILCLAFDHVKESVSSNNVVRLLKTKLWAKFGEAWNENLVQNKLISKIKQKSTTTQIPERNEKNVKMRWTTNI